MPRNPDLLDRPLPSAPETERSGLGAIMLDNRLLDEAERDWKPEYFYNQSYRKFFVAMLQLYKQHMEVNPATLANALGDNLKLAGGAMGIDALTTGVPAVARLTAYTKILREKSNQRWIFSEATKLRDAALNEVDESQTLITEATERFSAMREKNTNGTSGGSLADIQRQVEDHLYVIKAGLDPKIACGIERLDAITGGGISPGQLWAVAALSSRGKTSFLIQILTHIAKRRELGAQYGVVLFSLEMTSLLIGLRILAGATEFPLNHIRIGMSDGELEMLLGKAKDIFNLPFWIYTDCKSVSDIHRRFQSIQRQHPEISSWTMGIDYFGKLSGYGRGRDRYENRTQELKYIADYLQQEIAIGEGVGVIVPAQFNRSGWSANEPGPENVDGGEALFQACDLFATLHAKKGKAGKSTDAKLQHMSLAIQKQRNGPTAEGKDAIGLDFHKDRMMFSTRFEELGEEVPDEPKGDNKYL